MGHQGWNIPDDWDGQSKTCVRIVWPDSEKYRRLLVSLIYTLTRGREYDENTGTVTDAKAIGWEIFNDNFPLVECGDMPDPEIIEKYTVIETKDGGLIVIGGDDVGQVVTNTYIDESTGELVVEFGPCCIRRYSLSGVGGELIENDELPDDPIDPEPGGGYTACAKAYALWEIWVDLIDILFDGIASVKPPTAIINDFQKKYPSYKLSKLHMTDAYVAAATCTQLGFVSEVEAPAALGRVLCETEPIFDEGFAGCSSSQYDEWADTVKRQARKEFTFQDYNLTFETMGTVWRATALAIGANDAHDITTGVADAGSLCCPDWIVVAPNGTSPDAEGWYLSVSKHGDFVDYGVGAGWGIVGMADAITHDVYAAVMKIACTPDGTVKRMDWTSTEGPDELLPAADSSFSPNSSDHLESEQISLFIVFADSPESADKVAALLGLTTYKHYDQNNANMLVLDPPAWAGGQTLAFRMDYADGNPVTVQEFHWVHNTNSPSHS